MQMVDGLATLATIVDDESIAIGQPLFCSHFACYDQQVTKQLRERQDMVTSCIQQVVTENLYFYFDIFISRITENF